MNDDDDARPAEHYDPRARAENGAAIRAMLIAVGALVPRDEVKPRRYDLAGAYLALDGRRAA